MASHVERTLKQLYRDAVEDYSSIAELTVRHDSEEYQARVGKAIDEFVELKATITGRGIFSTNESFEDINTSEIKYLVVDYHLANLYQEFQGQSRVQNLKKSIICYLHFLTNLANYGLLERSEEAKVELLKKEPFTLQSLHVDAQLRRDEKIANYRLEKQLAVKLEQLDKLESNEDDYNNADEELIRDLSTSELKLFTIRSFDTIRVLQQELEIVMNAPELKLQEIEDDDPRQRKNDPTKFTDKLEYVNKDVLSKDGKILRPFTLMKRSDLQRNVYGTGQYLPTMTVEELLEQELANGGMVNGSGGNDGAYGSDQDEDDMEKADEETYKKRQWDDFTESHAKGSGNTINRG